MAVKLMEGLRTTSLPSRGPEGSRDDYKDVVIPAAASCLERHSKCRLLYVLGAAFEGYEAGAMLDDAKLGLAHFASWEKIAFVTDDQMFRTIVKALGFAMPGEVKDFLPLRVSRRSARMGLRPQPVLPPGADTRADLRCTRGSSIDSRIVVDRRRADIRRPVAIPAALGLHLLEVAAALPGGDGARCFSTSQRRMAT